MSSDEAMVIQLIKTRQLGLDNNQSTQTTSRATGLWGACTSVALARSTEPSTLWFCRLCLNTCGDRSSPAGPGEEEVLPHREPMPSSLARHTPGASAGLIWWKPRDTLLPGCTITLTKQTIPISHQRNLTVL